MVRDERLVLDVGDDELVCEPFGVLEAERLAVGLDFVPSALSRLAQNSSASAEPTRQTML